MNYPQDGTMLLLAALVGRCRLDVVEGDLVLANRDGIDCPAPIAALDELEFLGWVEVGNELTSRAAQYSNGFLYNANHCESECV